MHWRELWNELKITNDFLFNKLMQNQKLCKRLLEIVLDVKIERIEFPQTQKVMKMTEEGKGVHLDVYVADEKHTVYKYTFENRCKENPEIVLGDGTQKIFLNATAIMDGIEMDEDLKAFLSYVNGQESENAFVQELKEEMKKVKSNENWRRDYMMQHMRDQLNREKGRNEKSVELIRTKILKSKPLETIADELECEVRDIQALYDAVMQCGVESSVEEIMSKLLQE